MTHAPPKRQKPAHPVCAESERPPIGGHSKRTPAPGLQCTAADAPVASGHREQTPAPDSPCRNCPLPEGGRVLLPEPRGAARSKEILSPGSEEILRWSGWKVTPRRSPPEAREGPNLAGGKGDEADLPLLGGPRTQLQTSGHPTLFRRALGGNPVPMFPQRRPGGFPGPLSAQQRAGPLSALQRAGSQAQGRETSVPTASSSWPSGGPVRGRWAGGSLQSGTAPPPWPQRTELGGICKEKPQSPTASRPPHSSPAQAESGNPGHRLPAAKSSQTCRHSLQPEGAGPSEITQVCLFSF